MRSTTSAHARKSSTRVGEIRLVTPLAELVSESGIRERPPEKTGAISFAGTLGIAQFMPKTTIAA